MAITTFLEKCYKIRGTLRFLYVLLHGFTLIYKFVVGHRVGQFINGATDS